MASVRTRATAPRLARLAVVAIAVLALVPAWLAQTGWVWACAMDDEVRAAPCCPGKPDAPSEADRERDPSPAAHAMCCIPDAVDLATARPAAHADAAPALPPRVDAIAIVTPPEAAAAVVRDPDVTPRATGPPLFLSHLALLL
jgi:hypothetical protein